MTLRPAPLRVFPPEGGRILWPVLSLSKGGSTGALAKTAHLAAPFL